MISIQHSTHFCPGRRVREFYPWTRQVIIDPRANGFTETLQIVYLNRRPKPWATLFSGGWTDWLLIYWSRSEGKKLHVAFYSRKNYKATSSSTVRNALFTFYRVWYDWIYKMATNTPHLKDMHVNIT